MFIKNSPGQTDPREAVPDMGTDLILTKPFSPLKLVRKAQEPLARPREIGRAHV